MNKIINVLIVASVFMTSIAWGQSPDVQIGITMDDLQTPGSHGQRIMLDDNSNIHVNWHQQNFIAWNFRFTNGSWFGVTPAAVGSHAQLATTRDANPDDQVTVVAYHYDAGSGVMSWMDMDQGQGWGTWPNNPIAIAVADHIWPYIAIANNNNVIAATGNLNGDSHHVYVTTDQGISWSFTNFDSCSNLTQFVRASHNPGSNKVVFVHTQFITDTIASGQLDQDVWYILSTDGGVTWGSHTNLTDYQPNDSIRAYAGVSALFDYNDDLHIVWEGRKVDADNFYMASKIFHWCETTDTITVVNSPSTFYSEPGGWWIAPASSADPGAWRMPADRPEPVVCSNGDIYCLWHGNDDYNDGSAAGFSNGEFFGSYSRDNGITWSDYVNLTNTRSPGAGPGQCDDEDCMTANRFAVSDSVFITYIEDKDAGSYAHSEGIITDNPVRCWVFHKDLITGIKDERSDVMGSYDVGPTVFEGPLLLPRDKTCRVFDITGRVVIPDKIKPGIYFIEVDGKITRKVVKVR